MDDIEYELILTIKAVRGGATTSPLLPELVVRKEEELLPILISIALMYSDQDVLGKLGVDSMLNLAAKVEQDVADKKYKWELHRSMKK